MAVFVIVGGGEHGGTLSLPRRGIAHGAGDRACSDGGKKPIRKDDNSSTLRSSGSFSAVYSIRSFLFLP